MFITDFTRVSAVNSAIRSILAIPDGVSYGLLTILYRLFYAVATSEIFKAATISQIYARIQLVIGVFMVFELTMSVIKGIINPDTFTDNKNGAGSLLMRVAVSLVMLAMLVPISIPSPKNEYEVQVNNNGILFGTLYSLQNRVLNNNTLGRLILGTDDEGINYTNMDLEGGNRLAASSRMFATSILKAFYRLNATDDDEDGNYESVCPAGIPPETAEIYEREDQDPMLITLLVNETCESFLPGTQIGKGLYAITGNGSGVNYIISFTPIIPSIVAIILDVVMIIYIIEVAKRAIKLALLRLIAPIPIISYIDPKNGKDSAFNAWIKSLAETYASLFVRLAIMFFIMFVVQNLLVNGIDVGVGSGWVDAIISPLVTVFIIIGLFLFAKDAPKFLRQALGLKEPQGGFLSDLKTVVAAGAIGRATIGSARTGAQASRAADITNHGEAYANRFGNRFKHGMAGIVNAGQGLFEGLKASSGDKGGFLSKINTGMKAVNTHNQSTMADGLAGSTFMGRRRAQRQTALQGAGNTDYDKATREISQKKSIAQAGETLYNYLHGKGSTDGADELVETASITRTNPSTGAEEKIKIKGTYNEYMKAKNEAIAARQRGDGNGSFSVKVIDAQGNEIPNYQLHIDESVVASDKISDELADAAGDKWAQKQEEKRIVYRTASERIRNNTATGDDYGVTDGDAGYFNMVQSWNESIRDADDPARIIDPQHPQRNNEGQFIAYDGTMSTSQTTAKIKKAFKAAKTQATTKENSDEYRQMAADFKAIKKNN